MRAIVLNGMAGVVFGFLFWQYGLAAAMISHATADLVVHVATVELLAHKKETAASL